MSASSPLCRLWPTRVAWTLVALALSGCAHGDRAATPAAAESAAAPAPSPPAAAAAPDELDRLLAPRALHAPSRSPPAPTRPPPAPRQVVVRGQAADAALGAVVRADNGKVWYLAGLAAWPAGLVGKRVEVSGRAETRKLAPDPVRAEDGTVAHGMVGGSDVLVDARWRALGVDGGDAR